ncbi:MAG: hypothetical protein HY514_04945 [Candidatus Aenigmarchaeota archaeon]|nr:hypothetical protein [Candidatus Aenigmarchaeota archaeon]
MEVKSLIEAGLSKREAEAYINLLRLKEATAAQISKMSGEQRTNTYDTLNSLIKKGMTSTVIKGNKKFFIPADPESLVSFIEQKKKAVEEVLPDLKSIYKPLKSRPKVEVYEGKEGAKNVISMGTRETVKTGKEIIGIGIDQYRTRSLFPEFHKRWYKQMEKLGIKGRYLSMEGAKQIKIKGFNMRFLPKGYKSPVVTVIFGNKVTFWLMFEIITVIVVDSEEVAESYRSYVDILWKIAKPAEA